MDLRELRDGLAELRSGLRAAQPYLLSHHEPHEWDRCYAPVLFGRRVRVCARCLGIYPGIVVGLLATAYAPPAATGLELLLVLPPFALLDWALTTFTRRSGWNAVRTTTGALLGYAYGIGLATFATTLDPRVPLIGAGYALLAASLLVVWVRSRDEAEAGAL